MKVDIDAYTFNYSDIFFCYHSHNSYCFKKQIDFHSLVYVYSGELLLEEGGKKVLITKGGCAFIRRNHQVSMTKRPTADGEEFKGIFMILRRDFLRDYFRNLKQTERRTDAFTPSVVMLSGELSINCLFISMLPYFDSSIKPSTELVSLKMQEAVLALLQTDECFFSTLFDFTDPWKIDIVDFIDQNYMYNLSLEELANFTGRSLAAFKRDFGKISSVSPHKWILRKRLAVAKYLITEKKKKVSDVYLEVGFKNLSHFSTAFKKEFGYTPTQV